MDRNGFTSYGSGAPATGTGGARRRQLIEDARLFAAEGRWSDAVDANRQIIERSPKDVEAYNRLGKALVELHRYRSAWEAYEKAVDIDPANMIARRNLSRIEPMRDLEEEDYAPVDRAVPFRPYVFIEEVGKTFVDDLVSLGQNEVLVELAAGDRLQVVVEGNAINLLDEGGRYVGQLEPRISNRIIEFTTLGNEYEAYVTSLTGGSVRVIIRETNHSSAAGNRLSFPQQGKVAIPRAYLRDTARHFRDEPDMLLGDDDEDDGDDAEEFETTDSDDDETEFIEETGTTIDEDEEEPI